MCKEEKKRFTVIQTKTIETNLTAVELQLTTIKKNRYLVTDRLALQTNTYFCANNGAPQKVALKLYLNKLLTAPIVQLTDYFSHCLICTLFTAVYIALSFLFLFSMLLFYLHYVQF